MTDASTRTWAYHPGGIVAEIAALPAAWVPGTDIYTPAHAADMSEVTGRDPMPAFGWTTADGGRTFAVPSAPDLSNLPLPDISDRQFSEGLWHDGLISFEDCLAFVGPGVIPPKLHQILEHLPDDDTGGPTPRKIAMSTIVGATTYRFADPLVEIVREAFEATDPKWTDAHLRKRWAVWATL